MSTVCEVNHVEPRHRHGAPGAAARSRSADSRLWLCCLIFPALLGVWFALDHSWPFWDAADHVRVEFQYADLIRHVRPFKPSWWHDFLTVNYCYPATVHIFNGALKALLGAGRWVDGLSLTTFCLILNFSAFGVARLVFAKNDSTRGLTSANLAAVASLVVLNCYPVVSHLSHLKLLDYPHLSLFTLGMFTLLSWNNNRSWKNTIFCGLALAAACTTKQIAAFFLVAPCAYYLFERCFMRDWRSVSQLLFVGACVVAFLLLWFIPNWHDIHAYMSRNSGLLGERTLLTAFIPNFLGYVNCLTGMMGYPLIALAGLGLVSLKREQSIRLLPCSLASIVGFICMCALPFQLPEHRYLVPFLLTPALLSGVAVAALSDVGLRRLLGIGALTLALCGFAQFLIVSFSPYPVPLPKWMMHAALGINAERRGSLEPAYCPTPGGDPYGQEWVMSTCSDALAGGHAWINLLPSTPELSVHTLALVGKYCNGHVLPTTCRVWTPVGDRISFDEKSWKDCEFYLTKTGAQGLQFDSEKSAANYKKIEELLRAGVDYKLLAERTITDGSLLSIYRKVR